MQISKENFFLKMNYEIEEGKEYLGEKLENGMHTLSYVDILDVTYGEEPKINQTIINYHEVGLDNIHLIRYEKESELSEADTFYFKHDNYVYLIKVTDTLNSYYTEAVRGESLKAIQEKLIGLIDYDEELVEILTPFIEKEHLTHQIDIPNSTHSKDKTKFKV